MTMAADGSTVDPAERHRERRSWIFRLKARCRRRRSKRRRLPPPVKGMRGCRPPRSRVLWTIARPVPRAGTWPPSTATAPRNGSSSTRNRGSAISSRRSSAATFKFVDGTKSTAEAPIGALSGRPGSSRPHALDDRPGSAADRHGRPADRARANDLDGGGDAEAEGRHGRPQHHGPEARRRPGRAGPGHPGREGADEAALHAEAGSAGDDPIEPARVRQRSVARHLFGVRTTDAAGRHRAAGRHHRPRRQVRQPHRTPQGPNRR